MASHAYQNYWTPLRLIEYKSPRTHVYYFSCREDDFRFSRISDERLHADLLLVVARTCLLSLVNLISDLTLLPVVFICLTQQFRQHNYYIIVVTKAAVWLVLSRYPDNYNPYKDSDILCPEDSRPCLVGFYVIYNTQRTLAQLRMLIETSQTVSSSRDDYSLFSRRLNQLFSRRLQSSRQLKVENVCTCLKSSGL